MCNLKSAISKAPYVIRPDRIVLFHRNAPAASASPLGTRSSAAPLCPTRAAAERLHRHGGHLPRRSRHRCLAGPVAAVPLPAGRVELPVLLRHGLERLLRPGAG